MWKHTALLLCGSLIVCGLISFLLPNGSCSKAGKTAISFFLLFSLLQTIPAMKENFSYDFAQAESSSKHWQEQFQAESDALAYSMAENHILELIHRSLTQMGIQVLDLKIEIQVTDTDTLLSANLWLPANEMDQEYAIRVLLQERGVNEIKFHWQEVE